MPGQVVENGGSDVVSGLAVTRTEFVKLVTKFAMSLLLVVITALGMLAVLVIWLLWRTAHPDKAQAWPLTEATIQSVGTVIVHAGRNSYSVDVGDFSYKINDEYFSGRFKIASSFLGENRSPRGLVNQKIRVHFNPQEPEKFLVPETEVEGFVLGPYNEPFGEDIDPIDLNIDKI